MKLKMAKNSLFAILLRSPWWVSMLLVGAFVLASYAVLPEPYRAFGMMGGFPFLVIGCMAAWRQWSAPSPARVAEALDRAAGMPWRDFSEAMERGFARQGYSVTRLTTASADFKLEKAGQVTLLSCKRWKAANQGVEPLRDLLAAKESQGADHCMFASLGTPSENALQFAKQKGIGLVAGNELALLLMDAKP